MVKVHANKEVLFECEECNLSYKVRVLAEKCEAFCKKHKACNIDIIKHASRIE